MDLALALLIGAFLGARLFHIVYEEPRYYLEEPMAVFWIWQGGFVFYGGLAGALLLGTGFLKFRKEKLLPWLDLLALVFPLMYALGRFATLLSGSGYGRPTDLPWGISYPPGSEAPSGIALHPTPIYSMLWALIFWEILARLQFTRKNSKFFKTQGQIFFFTAMNYAVARLIIEQFRNDPRGENFFSLSVSSWLSLMILVASFIFFLKGLKDASKKTEPKLS